MWDLWKKGFFAWEAATAQYLENVLGDPTLMNPMGNVLTAAMKARARRQRLMARWWNLTGLPTRQDQERTLHALNQLQSRLMDLEEKLDGIQQTPPQ